MVVVAYKRIIIMPTKLENSTRSAKIVSYTKNNYRLKLN